MNTMRSEYTLSHHTLTYHNDYNTVQEDPSYCNKALFHIHQIPILRKRSTNFYLAVEAVYSGH